MKSVELYLKPLAQLFFTVIASIVAALADNKLTDLEWINVVILALGTVAVLGAGNLPEGVWKYTKTYVAAATAAAVTLHTFIADGIDLGTSQWLQIALAVGGVLGVYALKGPQVVPLTAATRRAGKHEAGA